MPEMQSITPAEKVQALRNANPKLTHAEACLLLGFNPGDPKTTPIGNIFDMFGNVFSGMGPNP